MNLVPIPSENCPICRSPGGQCSMVVNEVQTLRAWSVKTDEADFRAHIVGKNGPAYREAYVVQQYVCLNGKGIS